MQIYYPGKGHGVPFNPDHPSHIPLNGADAIFNCSTLSKENWKKYEKAARYVDMVKSKTPKLTLYTAKAKCLLMENTPQPDFQVIYYDGRYVCVRLQDLISTVAVVEIFLFFQIKISRKSRNLERAL